MAVNPLAKSNINPITVAMGETEVEKNIAITNNGPFDMYEPLTKTSVAAGATETVLVQGDDFRADVLDNLSQIEALADFDLLGVVVSNPVVPTPDAWDNVYAAANITSAVDGASIEFAGAGAGGRASFNVGKTAGKWALNIAVTDINAVAFEVFQLGFAHALADDFDLIAVTEVAVSSVFMTYVGVSRLGAPSVVTSAVLDTKTLPSAMTMAVFVDIDAGTWGVVDDEGNVYTDVGALANAEVGGVPATVGGITAELKLYPIIGASNGSGSPDFLVAFELLDANITGVPVGYTALTSA